MFCFIPFLAFQWALEIFKNVPNIQCSSPKILSNPEYPEHPKKILQKRTLQVWGTALGSCSCRNLGGAAP